LNPKAQPVIQSIKRLGC